MTKIYKINNKHVPFSLNDDPRVALAALLEALSDKEEGEICTCDIYCHNGVNMNNCVYKPHHVKKEEPKQEECLCLSGYYCPTHPDKSISNASKQSTSLKEEAEELIYKSIYKDMLTTTETTDKVLKLIQSHIVKEMQNIPSFLNNVEKEDIIKIINNK